MAENHFLKFPKHLFDEKPNLRLIKARNEYVIAMKNDQSDGEISLFYVVLGCVYLSEQKKLY